MAKRPNVLWIMTDQHHRNVAGFAGDAIVDTRNLDKLANRSIRFGNASCTNPVCTASRMSLLTGMDAHRCGAWSNHWIIFPEFKTWPGHFAEHGYSTCLVGKMHFGGRNQMNGFQHRPYGDLRHGLGHQPDPLSMYPGYAGAESAGVTEVPESLIQDVVVSRESLSFILEHECNEPDSPWFVCASYGRPHSPFTAPGRYIRRYEGRVSRNNLADDAELDSYTKHFVSDLTEERLTKGLEGYYACVDFVDDCIGELLDGIEKAGGLDNTIVIYTTDHGEMAGSRRCWGKMQYFDHSIGVPLLISGPNIDGDPVVRHPISLMDLFPTTCTMAGIPAPTGLDGIDMSELVYHPESTTTPRKFAPSAAYRYGVRIHYNQTAEDEPAAAWRCVRDERWKYVEVERGEILLFDLENDPEETKNVANLVENRERCGVMREWLYRDFSWELVHENLARDRARLPEYYSGLMPGTPNQYMLPDGRVFDAEKSLYDARWIAIPAGAETGGIIPQQFG